MPEVVYLPGREGKEARFYECRHCGWHLPESFYDVVAVHEQMPVTGKDFHDAVFVKRGESGDGYAIFVRNGAKVVADGEKKSHELLYTRNDVKSDAQIWPSDNDFASDAGIFSSTEIEQEIGKSLWPASKEELARINAEVFGHDGKGVHRNYFKGSAFRTLSS